MTLTDEQLAAIRERFNRLDRLNDAENPDDDPKLFSNALHIRAWACAWDAQPLLAEVERLKLAHITVSVALDESGRFGRGAMADIERLRAELAEVRANVSRGRLTCDISADLRKLHDSDETEHGVACLATEAADQLDELITLLAQAERDRDHAHGLHAKLLQDWQVLRSQRQDLEDRLVAEWDKRDKVLDACDQVDRLIVALGKETSGKGLIPQIRAIYNSPATDTPVTALAPEDDAPYEWADQQLADIEARVAADKAVIEAAKAYVGAYRATTLRPLPPDVKIFAISEQLATTRFDLIAAVDAHNALDKPSTAAHRCPDCDQPTVYQSFSGGREWYCKPCDNHGLYPQGAAPRRLQMLADGRWDELRQEMRKEIAARRTVPSVVDGQPDAKAGNYGEYKHRLPLDPKGAGSAERGPLAIRSEEPDSSAATGDTAHGQPDTRQETTP